jgi:branched-chain amino acid transport system permease protein
MDWAILSQQLINGLVLGSIYGLIAIGYTMVYGIIGMINFAHGDVYMVSAYLCAICIALLSIFGITQIALMIAVTLIITVLLTGAYGWAIERIAYRPLRHSTRLAPLISAIGVSLLLQNFVRLAQGSRTQAIPALFQGYLKFTVNGELVYISYVQTMIIITTLVGMTFLTFLIAKTRLGRMMRATQQDMTMAAILGVDPNRIIPLVFILGSMMAALAGILVTLNYGSFDFAIGFIIGIKAFTSAVLGGIGSLPGAMLGGLLLGLLESLFSGFIDVDYKDVFAFGVLILVLIFKPSGLLGTPDVEKV